MANTHTLVHTHITLLLEKLALHDGQMLKKEKESTNFWHLFGAARDQHEKKRNNILYPCACATT